MKALHVLVACLAAFFAVALYGGAASASKVYVNGSATGTGDGLSWANACTTIQAGVDVAVPGDEVWVARGTYTATASPSVAMKAGVPIYGGFVGNESTRDARNPATNVTIIDGANAYQCVTGASNATLDGFTVRNGRITTSGSGAGMYNNACTSLAVTSCTFSGNFVSPYGADALGGAMYNVSSSLTLTNCSFTGNSAWSDTNNTHGGAVYNSSSTLTLTECSFAGNTVSVCATPDMTANGGAIYASAGSTLTLVRCSLTSNSASSCIYADGGAIFSDHSTPNLLGCTFQSNLASSESVNGEGGAISSFNSSYDVVNCIFAANEAHGDIFGGGGAVSSYWGSPRFTNCTFTANVGSGDGYGGAVYCCSDSHPTFTNCILYGDSANNQPEIYCDVAASATFSYSCATGKTGTGCIDVNPLFVDGTDGGDGFDLRLQYNSQCINRGTDTSGTVPASALDFLGVARPQGSAFDMGAYEYVAPVAEFSASPASGSVPLAVTFTDSSTAPALWPITAWAWTFGDGGTSTEQNPSHTYMAAGTYTVSLAVTTANGTSTVAHTVTAERGTAPVTAWPTAGPIGYGQPLGASALSGGIASVPGAFAFADPGIVPNAGSRFEALVFTATDRASYDPAYGAASVTVAPVTPTVSGWPTASNLDYGQALSAATLNGGAASVGGVFAFARPDLKPSAGAYSAAVNFVPADKTNYAEVARTVDVIVYHSTPTITTLPTATAITYGQTLASSYLLGGQAKAGTTDVAGSFAFTEPTTKPGTAGPYLASVTFTPADTANYVPATGNVSVSVVEPECPDCVATTGPYTIGGTACLVVPGTFAPSASFAWSREDDAPLDPLRCTGVYCRNLKITGLKTTDSGTYVCTYTDGAKSDLYTVTIAVSEPAQVPAMPRGGRLVAVIALFGLVAAWRYRRHATRDA